MSSKVPSTKVLRPPGGGSSIMIGDDTPPPPQKAPARSPYAVEGDGVINPNKSAKDYTPSKPFGTEEDTRSSPQIVKKAGKSPFAVEDEEDEEESKKATKDYTPQKPFATSNDTAPRPSTKVRKPPGGESHISF